MNKIAFTKACVSYCTTGSLKRKEVFTTEHSTTLICCKLTANGSSKYLQKKGHNSVYLSVLKCIHHELTAAFFLGEREKNAAAFRTVPVKTFDVAMIY